MDQIIYDINKIKKEKNAIILAHFYAPKEVQEIADYVGDSFYLAKIAKETDSKIIVFCGVLFMGESAKIINPSKKVLMPDITADCPMAHMVSKEKIKKLREEYKDLAVVCYINSTASLKKLSDVCVTSSNALDIVKNLPNKNIFFIPDKNLGRFVKDNIKDKNIILNDGYCPIHEKISVDEVKKLKALYPDAKILAHPECNDDVCKMADFLGSTLDIINYANSDSCNKYIILTEAGVLYQLKKNNPEKEFYFTDPAPICKDMKLNTLNKILNVLKNEENEVVLNKEDILDALLPLDRMLERKN
ncbi:MAG: quinolinate synthase NadA [Ruminococcaceae bacterium]|nr:quinolinate synthase NadA [Oscillospiraceae bacterium]